MSKKGQALIEALSALGLSALFFTGCLKLWAGAVSDLKQNQSNRDMQICRMKRLPDCSSPAGFILITTMLQLTVLTFAFHMLIAAFLNEELTWKVSNWCFENRLQSVTQKPVEVPVETLQDSLKESGLQAPFTRFTYDIKGPFTEDTQGNESRVSFYNINWSSNTKLNGMFSTAGETFFNLKCGIKKLCAGSKCVYSVIADRS